MLIILASLKVESEASISNLPVVREFPNVSPNDIDDLSSGIKSNLR